MVEEGILSVVRKTWKQRLEFKANSSRCECFRLRSVFLLIKMPDFRGWHVLRPREILVSYGSY